MDHMNLYVNINLIIFFMLQLESLGSISKSSRFIFVLFLSNTFIHQKWNKLIESKSIFFLCLR